MDKLTTVQDSWNEISNFVQKLKSVDEEVKFVGENFKNVEANISPYMKIPKGEYLGSIFIPIKQSSKRNRKEKHTESKFFCIQQDNQYFLFYKQTMLFHSFPRLFGQSIVSVDWFCW